MLFFRHDFNTTAHQGESELNRRSTGRKYRRKRGKERCREKRNKQGHARAPWAALVGQGRGSRDPPQLSSLSALIFDTLPAAPFCLSRNHSNREAHTYLHTSAFLCSFFNLSKSSSSSDAQWQGSTRWTQGWSAAWMVERPSCRSQSKSPTNAGSPAAVISQRRSQKTLCEQSTLKKQGATLPTRPWRPSPKHANGNKRRGACTSESARTPQRSTAVKDTREKAEALERHVKTVDHEGRVFGDYGGRLLEDAPRSPGRRAMTPERALSAAEPDPPCTVNNCPARAQRPTQRHARPITHEARVASSMSGEVLV